MTSSLHSRQNLGTILLAVAYLVSRIFNLTDLPIFTDEAIYLRWAQIALHDSAFRFISLTDGKQPSFIWIVMILMNYISDPLLAGRLASVMAGFLGMIGMFFLGYSLFRSRMVGFWAAILYLISPFFLFYDRLALYDTLTATFTIWSLFLAVLLVRTIRLDVALILGMVLGGGVLTKTSAFFNLALLPATPLLFDWKKFKLRRLFTWVVLASLSSLMALIMYNALRLSSWFYIIARKNEEFVYSISEWLTRPLQFFLPNLHGLTQWLVAYLTIPILVLVVSGLIWRRENWRERLFLFVAFLLPFCYLSLFGKVLFPRFLLFMTVPLYVLAAHFLTKMFEVIKNKYLLFTFYFLLFLYPFYFDYTIIFNPVKAPLPSTDRNQYLDDWPAGFGIVEATTYLSQKAQEQDIFVATEGTFGLFPASIELYFWDSPNVEIKGYWPMTENIIRGELIEKAKQKPTYLVFKETQKIPPQWPLELKLQVRRGKGDTFLRLYRVVGKS